MQRIDCVSVIKHATKMCKQTNPKCDTLHAHGNEHGQMSVRMRIGKWCVSEDHATDLRHIQFISKSERDNHGTLRRVTDCRLGSER